MTKPRSIDELPEPADGGTVAVYDGESWVVHWRTDSAADPEHPDERWLCDWSDDPVRWSVVLRDAVQVYALGELLAEAPADTDRCTRCGNDIPRDDLWVLRGGYSPQGSWQGGYYCRDCCIATTGREPEESAQ